MKFLVNKTWQAACDETQYQRFTITDNMGDVDDEIPLVS